jgi:hypothetical protein
MAALLVLITGVRPQKLQPLLMADFFAPYYTQGVAAEAAPTGNKIWGLTPIMFHLSQGQ